MSGTDGRSLRARRGHVGLVVLLCVFLTSGASHVERQGVRDAVSSAPPALAMPVRHAPAPVSTAGPGSVALQLEAALELINPVLTSRERSRIAAAIERYSAFYELDPDLVLAVMLVESNARPWAHSPKGAVGLMQVMPHMMQPLGLAGNLATIESNIEAGCFILSHNIRRLGIEDGISAYFWGSDIRGVAYLEKVLEARARVKQLVTS